MICKLCEQDRKLIKAHILPKSFYKPLIEDSEPPKVYSSDPEEYPRRSRTGIYDKNILCAECDGKIGVWDDYAHDLLINKAEDKSLFIDGGCGYKLVLNYDYKKLKMFTVSLLWRASISGQQHFNNVDLGDKKNDRLRNIVSEAALHNKVCDSEYPFILAKFDDPKFIGMLDPLLTSFDNVEYCQFYLTGYVLYIKIDDKDAPENLSANHAADGKPLLIVPRSSRKGKDALLTRKIVKERQEHGTL